MQWRRRCSLAKYSSLCHALRSHGDSYDLENRKTKETEKARLAVPILSLCACSVQQVSLHHWDAKEKAAEHLAQRQS